MKKFVVSVMLIGIGMSCAREQQQAVNPTSSGTLINGYRTGVMPVNSISSLKEVPLFKGLSLKSIPLAETRSSFTVSLVTMDGKELNRSTQVSPNTRYNLFIKGEPGVQYHIRQYSGFDLVKQDPETGTYTIKSGASATTTMYMKVVPLFTDNNTVRQARSKTITLVDYSE